MKRLLIAGFGDVARRAQPMLARRFVVEPLSKSRGFDLDRPETLSLPAADAVLHCVPPAANAPFDTRTANLLAALERAGAPPGRFVYISTSGVYGDCGGERVDETRRPNPQSARALRRADAEARLRAWCDARSTALVILRAPGIYAADRLPTERIRAGMPVLCREDDVYSSHIHADDLARAVVRALEEDAPYGTYNVADDTDMRMGDWLDLVADHAGLARPRRVSRSRLAEQVPAEVLSFMGESRRLDNRRLKQVLGFALRYPTVREGLQHERLTGTH